MRNLTYMSIRLRFFNVRAHLGHSLNVSSTWENKLFGMTGIWGLTRGGESEVTAGSGEIVVSWIASSALGRSTATGRIKGLVVPSLDCGIFLDPKPNVKHITWDGGGMMPSCDSLSPAGDFTPSNLDLVLNALEPIPLLLLGSSPWTRRAMVLGANPLRSDWSRARTRVH